MGKKQRIELATKRLEKLVKRGMMPCVAEDFKNNEGLVYYSERTPLGGILYWANEMGDLPKEVESKIEEMETKSNATVYHVTHEVLNFGECWDLWCITDEDLEYGEDDFDNGYTFSYVYNASDPGYSDWGSIAYDLRGGGAVRVG